MSLHALVKDGAIIEYRDYAPNVDQTLLAPSKPRMLPVVDENVEYDSVTQVRTGPVITVEETQVRRTYTVRSKDAGELAAMKQAAIRAVRAEERRRVALLMDDGSQFALLILALMGIFQNNSIDRTAWPAGVRNPFNALYDTARTSIVAIHQVAVAKVAAVNALTTPQQISDYDVSVGWP